MNRKLTWLSALFIIGLAGNAQADDAGLQKAVSELGTLNGVALACKQQALAARMRDIMIDTVPKERSIGEQFEQATNESFIAFGTSGQTCPDGKTLAEQVDRARDTLRKKAGKDS